MDSKHMTASVFLCPTIDVYLQIGPPVLYKIIILCASVWIPFAMDTLSWTQYCTFPCLNHFLHPRKSRIQIHIEWQNQNLFLNPHPLYFPLEIPNPVRSYSCIRVVDSPTNQALASMSSRDQLSKNAGKEWDRRQHNMELTRSMCISMWENGVNKRASSAPIQ